MYHTQYDVLRPFVTDRVVELVRGRLLEGLKFFHKNALKQGFSRSDVKLALLLVKIGNPDEPLTGPEMELLKCGQRELKAQKRELEAQKLESKAPTKKAGKQAL